MRVLPTPPGPVIGDDPVLSDVLRERREILFPADERSGRLRQVAGQAGEPLALALELGRVRHGEPFGRNRIELERPADVLELEPPERNDLDVAPVLQRCVRGVGEHHARRARRRTRCAMRC